MENSYLIFDPSRIDSQKYEIYFDLTLLLEQVERPTIDNTEPVVYMTEDKFEKNLEENKGSLDIYALHFNMRHKYQ